MDVSMKTTDALMQIAEEKRQSEWARNTLIGASKYMQKLEDELWELKSAIKYITADRMRELVEINLTPADIERMKAELEQYKAQQWIPVEEKLPEVNVDVLVICKNGLTFVAYHREWEFTGEVIWNTRGPLGSGRRIATARITHWTPLPEPPTEAALDALKG